MITNDARCVRGIMSGIAMATVALRNKGGSFHPQVGPQFKEETSIVLHLEHVSVWCCNLDISKSRSEIPGSFSMWCWRRMEMISLTDRVRNEDVLHTVKKERNILRTVNRKKANWIGHILRWNCLLKHVIEGKVEGRIKMRGRRERRRKQLLDDLKKSRGY
jgi:hypothetical protein